MSSVEITSGPLNKFNKFCRLCLTVNGKLHQLFRPEETDALAIPLSMKVTLCTAIVISKHDNLPQKICQNCLNYINEWYSFRKKCKKVNLYLKQNLQWATEKEGSGTTEENGEEIKSLDKPKSFQEEDENKEEKLNPDLEDLKNENVNSDNNSAQLPHKRKKKFKCATCPDSFYYLKDLKMHRSFLHNHVKSGYSPKKVVLPPLTDPDIRLEGINVRTRYEMKCCEEVFFSKLKFRKHYSEKHPGEKPFMCETCGKKDFISEETLKRHRVLHTGKFRCEICLKTFTCNAILILHKRDKHENDKPFICDVCGKRFVTELLMNYHKRFHTGEKKYVCEECGLAVVTSSSLAKHKRIHSKEKPHVCNICGKGFIIKGRLVEHLRVHTGERPYGCQICQKGFTMRDKLKRHMRVHSGEKLFSCEFCGNNYSTKYGLSVHLKSHLGKCS